MGFIPEGQAKIGNAGIPPKLRRMGIVGTLCFVNDESFLDVHLTTEQLIDIRDRINYFFEVENIGAGTTDFHGFPNTRSILRKFLINHKNTLKCLGSPEKEIEENAIVQEIREVLLLLESGDFGKTKEA